jgi:hypothetical protein
MSRLDAAGGEGHSKEAFMVEDKTTPEQATPATEERRQPFGPGPLLFFGLVCLAVAVWCAHDLFGSAGSSWEASGSMGTIWFNWLALALGAVGAVYFFVLAAVRSKKPPDDDTTGKT